MTSALDAGRAAVVTGGARGIGLAVAEALLAEGVPVACLDVTGADTGAFRAAATAADVPHLVVAVDVRDRAAVAEAVRSATALGDVGYAVNCAGIDSLGRSAEVGAEDWQRVVDVDLNGVFFSCQAEHAVMGGHGGSIVNIASMSGHIVNRGVEHAGYGAAKAGVIHLSKSLGVEWAGAGIRVNSVSPGYVLTELTRHNAPGVNESFAEQTPLGRLAGVTEVAGPVLFLLGSASSFVTATDLRVDGGFTAW
jgi:NAD(P)-dependent dehydrogenase (short-subunit alcohol dehydrogenase family)